MRKSNRKQSKRKARKKAASGADPKSQRRHIAKRREKRGQDEWDRQAHAVRPKRKGKRTGTGTGTGW